ncbi:MAG: hypothetical protein EXQ70_02625 [Solirubrobacterales bacterium]|nr:hypothetical protein [Solirubrobacterales bacterium]
MNQVDATDFPTRSTALANEIRSQKPDLVGLQEVALWRTAPDPDLGPQLSGIPVATDVEYDFLQLLLDKLNANGQLYKAVVVKPEFDFEAPVNDDGNGSGFAGADRNARLTMRDVILARKGVKTSKPKSGTYNNLLQVSVSGFPIDVTRG